MSDFRPMPTGSLHWEGTAQTTPRARVFEIAIDDVLIPDRIRAIDEGAVTRIVESIETIGLQAQGLVTIAWLPSGSAQRAVLVAGRHRLEAFRRLGWQRVPAAVFDGDAAQAEQWHIAENLWRKELSALERAEQIARWMQLRAEQKPAHDAQVSGGRGHQGGISAAADELGVDRRTVQRARQVVGLAGEAKTVAVRLGLDNDQSALLQAAGSGGASEQIQSLQAAAQKRDKRLAQHTPERIEARHAATQARWQNKTDWEDAAARSLFEWLGAERCRQLLTMIDNIGFEGYGATLAMDRLRSLLNRDA